MGINGIFNVNKPEGKTSFEIVRLVRRLSGERKVGHGGTLDPLASGVLLVFLGQATRVAEFIINLPKTYRAQVELGISTDTYDSEGRVTQRGDPSSVNRDLMEAVLDSFRGTVEQVPPPYSALKYHGRPLYWWARAGKNAPAMARKVEIHRLDVVEWSPPSVTVEVECSKGTYIRSLAHDLGMALGCGAYLKNLVRLRAGPFEIEDSLGLSELEDSLRYGYWTSLIYPLDAVLLEWKAAIVSDPEQRAIKSGQMVRLNHGGADKCRAYSREGQMVALLRFLDEKGLWQPEKVFDLAP